jgi:hypothetical protein
VATDAERLSYFAPAEDDPDHEDAQLQAELAALAVEIGSVHPASNRARQIRKRAESLRAKRERLARRAS